MPNIKQQVRHYLTDNFLMGSQVARFGDADSFIEHHVLDSTGFLELITFLEEAFCLRIDDDEMVPENLDTLDNIEAFVLRKLRVH
ncbi:acyl carrier protein [Aquabacterium sp. A7-Y]|uniref:acyl carrier protein n=1 Tax=Aquabacterium sp. A7-Y TaxID=1349605 RepID=UPI00223D250D|nr:acyl carrier protein [Aquabacterium sp. A7-Y]MCW7541673.1 acyl carrier protein [Aquabacterium sp. A7-Y]